MHSVHFIRKPLNLGGVLGGFAVPNCKKIRCSCTEFGADSVQFAHFLHNSGGKTPILSRFRKLSPCAENSVHSVHSHQAQNPRASRAGHTPPPVTSGGAMPMHSPRTGGHSSSPSHAGSHADAPDSHRWAHAPHLLLWTLSAGLSHRCRRIWCRSALSEAAEA